MFLLSTLLIFCLFSTGLVDSLAQINCDEAKMTNELDDCLKPFNSHYRNGVEVLKDMTDTQVNSICESFEKIKPCMILFMYYCPDIKKRHNKKLDKFEYACTADRNLETWPIMPGVMADGSDEDDLSKENEERKWTIIKACIAAGVTVILILICALAELVSKLRVYLRVKKAAKQAGQNDLQSLIKKPDEPSNVETAKNSVKA